MKKTVKYQSFYPKKYGFWVWNGYESAILNDLIDRWV